MIMIMAMALNLHSGRSRHDANAQVDWDDEKECFESFLRELAFFYSPRPFSDLPTDTDTDTVDNDDDSGDHGHPQGDTAEETQHQLWQLEHVLFPSMRRYTAWPREMMNNGDVRQVANLPDLFRIFERC
jgi:DNA mismatch repair protein MLH1